MFLESHIYIILIIIFFIIFSAHGSIFSASMAGLTYHWTYVSNLVYLFYTITPGKNGSNFKWD